MPRVSVITPVYNPKESFWEISRESILNQTSNDFEWIVVDDGSTEEKRFEYDILLERNYGPSVARNAGFNISRGDIITYLDLGDELASDRIENIIKLFDEFKIELLFSAYNIIQNGQPFRFDHFDYIGKHPNFPTAFEYIRILQTQNISIPLGVAHKRTPFILAGGFQRGIVCGEDGILWRRMVDRIASYQIMFSDDLAGDYYITENGQSRTQRRFEMGGFAFDGSRNDNGKYLDEGWFKTFSSEGLYD